VSAPAQWEAALSALKQEKDAEARTSAARQLREILFARGGDETSQLAVWRTLVQDRQDTVRRVGAQLAMELFEPDEAEQVLVGLLEDRSPLVRVEAAGGLADLERRSSLASLETLLLDDAFPVRFEAARGLAALGDDSGLQVLIEALEQDSFRFRALGTLAALGDGRALPAIRHWFHRPLLPGFERTQAAGALAKLGDAEGERYLLNRIQSRRKMDRAFAIELCGDLKLPAAFGQLFAILADAEDDCRGAAARGLGRLGDRRAIAPLWSLLEDQAQPDELRLDAAEGLCLLGGVEAKSRIEQALRTLKSSEALSQASELLQDFG
jgi:HEAT repeat protein